MNDIKVVTEYIELGQFLKFIGKIVNGGEAKSYIFAHKITINGQREDKRGKKIYANDVVCIDNEKYRVVKGNDY